MMKNPPRRSAPPIWKALFDDCFREQTIEVLRERAGVPARSYTAEDAETLEKLLSEPIYAWVDAFGKGHRRHPEIIAADAVLECVGLDVAYGFKYRQQIEAAHIDKLDRLWAEFQRLAGVAMVADQEQARIQAGRRNAKNAKGRHKPQVTGSAIRQFKTKHEYDKGTAYGWIVAAAAHFKVDRNTIKAHENDE